MDDKLSVVMSALESIKKHGWCNIWDGHKEEIPLVKYILKQCGYEYSVYKQEVSEQIFVKKHNK